ncbi:MAG: stage II sporulation protein P, partial [Oscillospiraceae bacterium]|nr:stage II sporulation protein P [Oscillospiraceae bacterium]
MDWYDKTMRLCLFVLICAVVLRLGTTGFFDPVVGLLTKQEVVEAIWFLETGRRFPSVDTPVITQPTQPTQPTETEPTLSTQPPTEPTRPLDLWDAGAVQINSYCGYEPQVEAWLEQPLEWQLRQSQPTVLILHSHATESYGESPYRSKDTAQNMVSIGDLLVQKLEQAGIHVLHDRSLHDGDSYSDAYGNSRASV